MRTRLNPKDRKEFILDAAIDLSKIIGYKNISRDGIAGHANVSMGLINKYFGTIENLRDAVMESSIKKEIIEIIAQGLGVKDPQAQNAPQYLKDKALLYLAR